MTRDAALQCAARKCQVRDHAQLYRIGYCGGFGKGQGAKTVSQRKKGCLAESEVFSKAKDGIFHRGDVLCPSHLRQLKEVFMFTAHPVQKSNAAEKQALVEMGLPSTKYCIGVAPTSRGKCRECGGVIEEGSLRFGVEQRFGAHYEARWRHWKCAKQTDLERALSAAGSAWSAVAGFSDLPVAMRKVVLPTNVSSKRKVSSIQVAKGTSAKFARLKKQPAGEKSFGH